MPEYSDPLKQEFQFLGRLADDGRSIQILNSAAYQLLFKPLDGQMLQVSIKKFRENKTQNQLRYTWGVLIPLTRRWLHETAGEWHSPEVVYAWLRTNILGQTPEIKTILGQEVIIFKERRFSEMTKQEFSEAIDKIIREMSLRGLVIPPPTGDNFLHDFFKRSDR